MPFSDDIYQFPVTWRDIGDYLVSRTNPDVNDEETIRQIVSWLEERDHTFEDFTVRNEVGGGGGGGGGASGFDAFVTGTEDLTLGTPTFATPFAAIDYCVNTQSKFACRIGIIGTQDYTETGNISISGTDARIELIGLPTNAQTEVTDPGSSFIETWGVRWDTAGFQITASVLEQPTYILERLSMPDIRSTFVQAGQVIASYCYLEHDSGTTWNMGDLLMTYRCAILMSAVATSTAVDHWWDVQSNILSEAATTGLDVDTFRWNQTTIE